MKAVRRTYIKKKNGKLRPLGIPIIKDRIYQNIVKNAPEPHREARFEPNSYGFRPKRSTHDAIANLYTKLNSRTTRKWIFEGDFKGCFDNLSHEHILNKVSRFPNKQLIENRLKAGYVDNDTFRETDKGTPQGGVISPSLANTALHGPEKEIGVEYQYTKDGYKLKRNSTGTVRCADDFVIICHTQEQAESMYEKLQDCLDKRRLTSALDKTKVTHIESGFDFLGFNIRQCKEKLPVKPSKAGVKKAKEAIKDVFAQKRGRSAKELTAEPTPIIKRSGNYWQHAVSKEIYSTIDNYVWKKTVKFLNQLHPTKTWDWKKERYFKPDRNGISKDNRILTNPKNHKTQLMKMSWIPIERHVMVKFDNSPDNPELKQYFEQRDEKQFKANNVLHRQKIAKAQNHKCRICGQSLIGEEGLEMNHIVPQSATRQAPEAVICKYSGQSQTPFPSEGAAMVIMPCVARGEA